MAEFASKGVAGTGLGLGIAGTALGVLNGGLGNLFNGWGNNACCAENTVVNRYELCRERDCKQGGRLSKIRNLLRNADYR